LTTGEPPRAVPPAVAGMVSPTATYPSAFDHAIFSRWSGNGELRSVQLSPSKELVIFPFSPTATNWREGGPDATMPFNVDNGIDQIPEGVAEVHVIPSGEVMMVAGARMGVGPIERGLRGVPTATNSSGILLAQAIPRRPTEKIPAVTIPELCGVHTAGSGEVIMVFSLPTATKQWPFLIYSY
jgi:hypothetical protein